MAVSYNPGIVTNGLVLCLDAANRKSYPGTGTGWFDLSGLSNNGTLINGPIYNNINNGYFSFDGTDDYITNSISINSGESITYCGWLYSTETTAIYKNFVDSGPTSTGPMIWWNTSGQIEFDTSTNHTTSAVYRNQWVYVALSKPSGSSAASYYVNGVLSGTGSPYTIPTVTPSWFNRATANTWKGYCSCIQVYNRALAATEISQNFNALRGRFGI